jgi:hypothetical protein
VAALLVLFVLAGIAASTFQRPPRRDDRTELYRGITYRREARSEPRPLMVHIVEIDLTAPGIRFLVTPPQSDQSNALPARTTSEFLEEFGVQIAVNGSYFAPFHSNSPWDFYPRRGDPVYVKGLAISQGRRHSDRDPEFRRAVLCVCGGLARIEVDECPPETTQALPGSQLLVKDGKIVFRRPRDDFAPRTAIALNNTTKKMWLIVVDGRQPGYSVGVRIEEVAHIAWELGAEIAFNLDGGGSSTLVMSDRFGPRVLNAPYHTRVRMRERYVGNHLGVFALPLKRDH